MTGILIGYKKFEEKHLNEILGFNFFKNNNKSLKSIDISLDDFMLILDSEKSFRDILLNFEMKKAKALVEKMHFYYTNNIEGCIGLTLRFVVKKRRIIANNVFKVKFNSFAKAASGKSARIFALFIVGTKEGYNVITRSARVKFAKLENITDVDMMGFYDIFSIPINRLLRTFIGDLESSDEIPSIKIMNLMAEN